MSLVSLVSGVLYKEETKLTAEEVINKTFRRIVDSNPSITLAFPEPVYALIASDCDDHRDRYGYMKYNSAEIITCFERSWAILSGKSYGSYPAEPYKNDIIAVDMTKIKGEGFEGTEDKRQTLAEYVTHHPRFWLTLAQATWLQGIKIYGSSRFLENTYGPIILEQLQGKIPDEWIRENSGEHNLLRIIGPPTSEPKKYNKEFISNLYEAIMVVLEKTQVKD